MISVFRNFAPIAITLVEWLWMKERKPSAGVLFSMALLIMGAVIAALNDLAFTVEGYLWILTNVFANVAHLIVLRKLKLNRDLSNMQVSVPCKCALLLIDPMEHKMMHVFTRPDVQGHMHSTQILHYSALWSLFWLIPVGLYEDIWASWRHLWKMPLNFKLVVASTGINSVLMFLATVWCLERVSVRACLFSSVSCCGAGSRLRICTNMHALEPRHVRLSARGSLLFCAHD